MRYPGIGYMILGAFALYEIWQEKKEHDTGCKDFWECIPGMVVMLIAAEVLEAMGICLRCW